MAEVSAPCRKFIDQATARDWKNAVLSLNGLEMYELLRSVKALDKDDVAALRDAMAKAAVDGPRIEYALSVVADKKVPKTAPGDLEKTGQVKDAQEFIKLKLPSILRERIPKAKVKDYIKDYNTGLASAGNATMQALYGAPREDYSQECQPVTNKDLAKRIVSKNVGPFTVPGLDKAVESLTTVMKSVLKDERLVYRALGNVGMACARNTRGSTTAISNHSWGTAIDLTVDGDLVPRGENTFQLGLLRISSIFNDNGWYWGLGFKTTDSMHFEIGEALVKSWKKG
jgi:hypothetical protein